MCTCKSCASVALHISETPENRAQSEHSWLSKQVGMPIDEFLKEAMEGLDSGEPEFAIGLGQKLAGTVDQQKFEHAFGMMCDMAASRGL